MQRRLTVTFRYQAYKDQPNVNSPGWSAGAVDSSGRSARVNGLLIINLKEYMTRKYYQLASKPGLLSHKSI